MQEIALQSRKSYWVWQNVRNDSQVVSRHDRENGFYCVKVQVNTFLSTHWHAAFINKSWIKHKDNSLHFYRQHFLSLDLTRANVMSCPGNKGNRFLCQLQRAYWRLNFPHTHSCMHGNNKLRNHAYVVIINYTNKCMTIKQVLLWLLVLVFVNSVPTGQTHGSS